jgi:Ca2+-binding RTX toxin-like protein
VKLAGMRTILTALLLALLLAAPAAANTSHDGWPAVDGMLLMNKDDSARPLDAQPGHDPFSGADPNYSCDTVHTVGSCLDRLVENGEGFVVGDAPGHNELLGGHGSDTIHAGPWGDVIWGDYKPSGQPASQSDQIYGGAGRDFIYASHGSNNIQAGDGNDWIKAHFGRGVIDCGAGKDVLYISRKAQKHYTIRGCETISHKTLGF